MTKQTEALKLALDLATVHHTDDGYAELRSKVRRLAKEALAQPAQEPVACEHEWFRTGAMEPSECRCIKCGAWNTTPPQRKPLTDEKIKTLYAALKDVERTKGFSSENWFQAGLVMGEALHDIKENT